jgi:hypothetical protein
MNTHTECNKPLGRCKTLQESRSPRFNVPVRHPSKWSLVLERLLASPMRLHRYRTLSVRMLEETMDKIDCGSSK